MMSKNSYSNKLKILQLSKIIGINMLTNRVTNGVGQQWYFNSSLMSMVLCVWGVGVGVGVGEGGGRHL